MEGLHNDCNIQRTNENDAYGVGEDISTSAILRSMRATMDAILCSTHVIRQDLQVLSVRVEEIEKKHDLLMNKFLNMEPVNGISSGGKTNESNPIISRKGKSPVQKDLVRPPNQKATPRQLHSTKAQGQKQRQITQDVSTVMLDISDDEKGSTPTHNYVGNVGKVHRSSLNRPSASKTKTSTRMETKVSCLNNGSADVRQCASQNAELPSLKPNIGVSPKTKTLAGSKLLFTTPQNQPIMKPSNTYSSLKQLTKKRATSDLNSCRHKSAKREQVTDIEEYPFEKCKILGLTMPQGIKTTFKPTEDMGLTYEQIKLCAYVFHPDNNMSEVLLKMGATEATRLDFQCLCPGNTIHRQIIYMMAQKATWNQQRVTTKTLWSLPPSFARDVIEGNTIENLLVKYAEKWLSPYKDLQHIYIPVEMYCEHWYLIVVCIDDRIVYQLDSNLEDAEVTPRQDTIKCICDVMTQMMQTDYFPPNYLKEEVYADGWEIVQAKAIPKCGHSFNSAVWVLDWLDIEHAFQPNLISVQLDEQDVRMKVALQLLTGDHNEYRNNLQEKAEKFWQIIKYSSTT